MNTEFQELLDEIERVEGCGRTKDRIKSILRTRAGRRIRFTERAFSYPEHIRVAITMLRSGMTRSEARQALMDRFGIGRVTAYGLLSQGLDLLSRERQSRQDMTHDR